MMTYILSFLVITLSSISLGMDGLSIQSFGYNSTTRYADIVDSLRQSPHPWAKSFLKNLEAVHVENREDIRWLSGAIKKADAATDEATIISKVSESLSDDKAASENLVASLLGNGYKSSDCWPLFTGLNKFIGPKDNTGIFVDCISFVKSCPNIVEGIVLEPVFDNKITITKTAAVYVLLEKYGQGASDLEIEKNVRIAQPNPVFPNVANAAKTIRLYDINSGILLHPCASYSFGANPIETRRHVWDCSSFVALVIGCPLRFSTMMLEEAWLDSQRSDSTPSDDTKFILNFIEPIPNSNLNHKHLQAMDILVWRSSGGGHVGFYLGEGENGEAIIGDSNRSDDKTFEGTGISQQPIFKKDRKTYAFRMKDKR
jgi:hypothetical protein